MMIDYECLLDINKIVEISSSLINQIEWLCKKNEKLEKENSEIKDDLQRIKSERYSTLIDHSSNLEVRIEKNSCAYASIKCPKCSKNLEIVAFKIPTDYIAMCRCECGMNFMKLYPNDLILNQLLTQNSDSLLVQQKQPLAQVISEFYKSIQLKYKNK